MLIEEGRSEEQATNNNLCLQLQLKIPFPRIPLKYNSRLTSSLSSHVLITERRETYSAHSISISIRLVPSSSGQLPFLSSSLSPFSPLSSNTQLLLFIPLEQLENLREQLSVQQAIADGANNFLEVVANDGSQEELKNEIEQELHGAQTLIEQLEIDIARLEQLIGESRTLHVANSS